MRWIVALSLKFRFIVVALAAGMVFVGVQQVNNAAVDVFSEFSTTKETFNFIAEIS